MKGTAAEFGTAAGGGLVLMGIAATLSFGVAPASPDAADLLRPQPSTSPLGLRVVERAALT